jgi:competence protein ComEC
MVGRYGSALASTVYQVGHHGSRTSSSTAFLAAVRPEVAVYSAGAGNQYGHPHPEVVDRLLGRGIQLYGTDVHGTVTIRTDGTTYSVSTVRSGAVTPPASAAPSTPAPTLAPIPPPATGSGCGAGQVDINAAGFDELQLIVHIGPVRAEQMLRIRPFSSVDGMTRVDGIGPARLADIKAQGVACVP